MRAVDVDLPAHSIVATPSGLQLLESNERLRTIVTEYCETPRNAAGIFRHYDCLRLVGSGGNSDVWGMNGITLKVSTSMTGKLRWQSGPSQPQDGIGQTLFMEWFQHDLAAHASEDAIRAPLQFFALRTPSGDYLQAEQLMEGWRSISRHCLARSMSAEETQVFVDAIHERLAAAMGRLTVRSRLGANDLGFEHGRRIRSSNVLIQEDQDDPWTAPLCVIDQPQVGLRGTAAIMVVKLLHAAFEPELADTPFRAEPASSEPKSA